jgi:hypothetical protein
MSGTQNPLANARAATPDPMMRHAQIWQHMSKQPPDALKAHVALMDYVLPILGALANKPDVKPKDVIKAVADAAAQGKMLPSQAIATIQAMPSDDTKLRGWLRDGFQTNLAATVHAKAVLMGQEQPQAGNVTPGQEMPMNPMGSGGEMSQPPGNPLTMPGGTMR